MNSSEGSVANTAVPTRWVHLAAGVIDQASVLEVSHQVRIVGVQQPGATDLSQRNDMWII